MPEVDIVTTHHYPSRRNLKTFAEIIRENWEMARGKKPYVVGEFGFVSTAQMRDAMKTIMDTGMSGGLLWSLRFRDRDGGFYWHSEPSGGNNTRLSTGPVQSSARSMTKSISWRWSAATPLPSAA